MPTTKTSSVPTWAVDRPFERTPIWDEEFEERWRALHGQGEEPKPPVVKRPPAGRKPRTTRG